MSKQIVLATKTRRRRRQVPRKYPVRFRALPVLTGRGAYRKKYPRSTSSYSTPYGAMIGGGIGTALGGPVGGMIGGGVGHLAQSLIKHITGFGDYTVEVNSLMGNRFNPPELINQSHRSVCLRHREFITDITASSAFTINAFDINPGLSDSFPWLSGVANNFEEYMIAGMVYEYKSLSADYTTASSAALGYVAMATQYNPLLPEFTDKVHLENYEFANSAKPSENFIHPIECKKSLNPVNQLFVRTGAVETGADQRLYDLGKFQIATAGNSGSGILGELWCTYEIHFFKPKLVDAEDILMAGHWQLNSVTNASPLGSAAATEVTGTNLPVTLTGGSIEFPSTISDGRYLITYNVVGSSTATTMFTLTATSNCSIPNKYAGNTVANFKTQNGVTTTGGISMWTVTITGPSAIVVVNDDGTLPASATSGDLWIVQLNSEL
ncbi:capsid protein [Crucivirus-224]|nr:capsid protein [Crucivirus-224]